MPGPEKDTSNPTEEELVRRLDYFRQLCEARDQSERHEAVSGDELSLFRNGLGTDARQESARFSAIHAKPLARQAIRSFQRQRKLSPKEIRVACAETHFQLSQAFSALGVSHIVTIGDVQHKGAALWNVTHEGLLQELRGELLSQDKINLHAWLTFPDMSILDATLWFFIHRVNLPKAFSWEDRVSYREPVDEELIYKPMLVGKRILANVI